MRFIVHASKTEHHDDNGIREVPSFPELEPLFRAVQKPDKIFVINRYRASNSNLGTQFIRYLKKAGIQPWVSIFDNLRASCETDLHNSRKYSPHVISGWIGHDLRTAKEHYLTTVEDDFKAAVRKTSETFPSLSGNDQQDMPSSSKDSGVCKKSLNIWQVKNGRYRTRTELVFLGENQTENRSAAICPDLQKVIDAWPGLNESQRARILAISEP